MALALIGESILAAVLEVLMERVLSPMVRDFFKSQKIDDEELKKLKARMRSVSKLLNDAQEKQITDAAVKEWLDELKDAVYQADDFLDEIAYRALRLKLEGESRSQTCTDQLRSFLASLNPCRKGVREVQTELAKILRSLEELVGQKDVLGLIERIGEKPSSRITPTSSLVDESGVYGRDAEKEAIVKLLLADDTKGRHLDVISIVGMGGVGKTTLAQLLYKEIVVSNDRSQKSSFDLKAWVYVSEEFDVLKVTKDILKGVGSMNCDNMTEDQLHCELEKKLSGNKLLLVLDDVWSDNQSQWEFLLKPFMSVRQGSKIIVTTRNENVASIISSVSTHHIKKLSDDDCWLVLSKHAFDGGNFTAHPELELIGRQIARKCNGLPLAAKTLGSLLCSKRAMKEWMKILKSNFWELPNDNILSPLRLSYHYLPSHLKRCFSYCAIIPKGYKFTREEIVLLWMAEGFLVEPRRNNEMEEIGYEYFNELVARSFFQQSSPSSSLFVMHDLINDLARFASGDFCFRLEGDDSSKTTERTRHLSYRATKDDSYQTFKAIKNPQLLRTLLCPSGWPRHMIQQVEVICNLLPALKCLRVLSLHPFHDISVLPNSICNLKHLRYLDLSHTKITRLPESMCSLYNLEILNLHFCVKLVELPVNMRSLINLRHLDLQHTKLPEMPLQMGKLTKLRKLTDFFIGKQSGSNIKELGKLQHLSGDLSIWNLQNVTDARDSFEANLKGKEHLEKLELVWDCDMDNPLVHERVLEQLQPPVNVKILSINGYRGTRFPDWVGNSSLPLLQELYIRSCPNLKKALFTHFPSLTKLDIRACEQFEIEFFPLELFPKLESLTIGSCPNLVSFSKGIPLAPNLKEFQLWSCSNLKSLPENMHSLLPSLEKLSIFHCPKLESFPVGGLPSKLKGLAIWGCDKLIADRAQWDLQSLHVLSRFSIADNDVLECFPEETLLPSSLTRLEIRTHKNLKSLDYKGLQHLTSLRELIIMNCMEVSMPEEGLPPSISSLTIWQCPLLEKKCEGELRKFPKYIRDPEYMTSGRKSI